MHKIFEFYQKNSQIRKSKKNIFRWKRKREREKDKKEIKKKKNKYKDLLDLRVPFF